MGRQQTPKKPWLAAGLTLLVTGLGQLYLRRWLRAATWLALSMGVGWLFVPESALMNPADASLWDVAPLTVVAMLSVVDAYVVASNHNRRLEVRADRRCSSCYRELESEIAFCPWCGTELERSADDTDGANDPTTSRDAWDR